MNHVILRGQLTSDPEFRELAGGGRAAILSVRTMEDDADASPQVVTQDSQRHRVSTSCEGLVGFAESKLRKGSRVHIEGSLETNYWVDQQNIERYSTEVVIKPQAGKLELIESPVRPGSLKDINAAEPEFR